MVFNKFRFEICGFFAVFLLLCSSFINPCFAAEPEKITIQANWKMGDIFQYRVNQTIKSADKDPFSTEYHVKLAVDEVTDAGSLLTVSSIAPNIEDTLVFFRKKSTLSPLGLVSFVSQKIPLKIRTDENGSVESLENWKEVAALMIYTIDDLSQLNKDKTSQAILVAFKTQFGTEASTRQQMFKEISFLFDPYGTQLTPGKELVESVEIELPKLAKLKATESYLLKLNNPKKGQVTLKFKRDLDQKQLMPIIKKIVGITGDVLTPELEKEFLRASAIADQNTTTMTGVKGIVSFVEHQRNVGLAKNLIETQLLRISLE